MTVNATCPECGEHLRLVAYPRNDGFALPAWLACDTCGLSWSEDELDAIHIEDHYNGDDRLREALVSVAVCRGEMDYDDDPDQDWRLLARRMESVARRALRLIDVGDRHEFTQVEVDGLHLSPMCKCGEAPDHSSHATGEPGVDDRNLQTGIIPTLGVDDPPTITVPKAEWEALVDAIRGPDSWAYGWSCDVAAAARALVKAVQR